VAHLLIAVDPDALGGREQALDAMNRLIGTVRANPPADQTAPVLIPGDPQRSHRERQLREGIELDSATIELLDRLGSEHP